MNEARITGRTIRELGDQRLDLGVLEETLASVMLRQKPRTTGGSTRNWPPYRRLMLHALEIEEALFVKRENIGILLRGGKSTYIKMLRSGPRSAKLWSSSG
jgi:hypothetical protein